jgi:hypothetical protein
MKEVGNYFDRYDLFAEEIPKFHLDGQKKIGTSVGFSMSVLLVTIVAIYTGVRTRVLITGARPNISSYNAQNERNVTELVDLNDHSFKVAFSVQSLHGNYNKTTIDDSDFVEWLAHWDILQDGNLTSVVPIGVHKCT